MLQEQEALVKELAEMLKRQKIRVNALQKERAELSAQLTSYHPVEQDKLRAEVGTLRERIGELAGLKVLHCNMTDDYVLPDLLWHAQHISTSMLTGEQTHSSCSGCEVFCASPVLSTC